ncbi:MAG: membrane protein insertion efficiency factor YidD [Burkholderiaceae bacterium]|nr:membrane protein insertion efficiency factor YidD [Burkholderiaceae bacterium]
MKSPLQWTLLLLLRFYQLCVSPLLGQNCRFYPTCSQYAIEAITAHGVIRGIFFAVCRLCRCHPWHEGGVDPVPPPRGKSLHPSRNENRT